MPNEDLHRAFFQALSQPAVVADQQTGRILDVNAAATRAYGYPRDEMIGMPATACAAEPERAAGSNLLEGGRRFHRRKDGSVFPVEVATSAVEHEGRTVLLRMAWDLTERTQLEASLAEQDRLATMDLLANGVAHELNNPLSHLLHNLESVAPALPQILDLAQRCEARQLSPSVACSVVEGLTQCGAIECTAQALASALRIKDISRRLGAFTRVERSERGYVDVNPTLESSALAAQNELRFRAKLVKQLGAVPPVWAAEGKLAQVFLDLILNAAQAIDDGDAENNRVTLRTWAADGSVFVEVADTGKGIPSELMGRIFEPFFTTKGVGGGSGLGLTICRKIITESDGVLKVESEVGKGTRVLVCLPARPRPEAQGESRDVSLPVREAPRGRILAVDDEVAMGKVLTRALGKEHEVLTVTSGKEARAMLEKDQAFDLILCDVMMPEVSGVDLHRWLAGQNPALAKRVVFMSGGAFLPNVGEYLDSVGNLRLDKPFTAAHLHALVSELILAAKTTQKDSARQ